MGRGNDSSILVKFVRGRKRFPLACIVAAAVLAIAAAALTIAAVCSLAVSIGRKFCRRTSPYLVFAGADILIGICVAAYAVYDIQTDTGWFAGLLGTLLLIFVLPIVLVLLLADVLVWKLKKPKQ